VRAFLFSGQGSQKAGMADPLIAMSCDAARIYEQAESFSKINIRSLQAEELTKTVNTQLAVSVYSAALWSALPESERRSFVLAGFSLGEYSALYAAGVISLDALVQLILWRSRFMQAVIDRSDALGMAAVIGLDAAAVERVLKEADASANPAEAVYAVNFNSPVQTVISGATAMIERLKPPLKAAGAGRIVTLRVAGAFHSPYFQEAADRLCEQAAALTFSSPSHTLYSNLTAAPLPADTNWPEYLKKTLVSPVYFTDELRRLQADGVTGMVEVGPGKTLIGFADQTLTGMPAQHASALLV